MAVIKQRTLFNEEYLKEYSLLPLNFDVKEIWNFVPLTEQLHIVPIIGKDLYNELLDQVENNTVSPENASLLLEIYPFEGLALMEVSMPYLAMHITEVGITKGKSENSDSVEVEDINYLTNYVRSQMEPLKTRLVDFLNEHSDLYPLYNKPTSVCSDQTKTWNVYGMRQINTDVDFNRLTPQLGLNPDCSCSYR